MEEEGEELSFFFRRCLLVEDFFFGPVDEDVPGFFVHAVFTGKDGAHLLVGVVGIGLEKKGDLVLLRFFQLPPAGGAEGVLRRAEAAAYKVLVVTLDSAIKLPSPRAERAGFRMPDDVQAAGIAAP